jgi:hypothetical protein
MQPASLLLSLFRAALQGDQTAFGAFCDALEGNGHLLAPLARELANATPEIPEDLAAVYEPAILARGTNWRIEYRPGELARRVHPDVPLMQGGRNAEVGDVYEADGPWTELDGVATVTAPSGGSARPNTFSELQEEVNAAWIRMVFDAVRFSMIGNLLVGHQVVMVFPGRPSFDPVLPPLDHRISWLVQAGW